MKVASEPLQTHLEVKYNNNMNI